MVLRELNSRPSKRPALTGKANISFGQSLVPGDIRRAEAHALRAAEIRHAFRFGRIFAGGCTGVRRAAGGGKHVERLSGPELGRLPLPFSPDTHLPTNHLKSFLSRLQVANMVPISKRAGAAWPAFAKMPLGSKAGSRSMCALRLK